MSNTFCVVCCCCAKFFTIHYFHNFYDSTDTNNGIQCCPEVTMCCWQEVKINQPTPSHPHQKEKKEVSAEHTDNLPMTMYTFLVTMPRVKTTYKFRSLLHATHLTPVDIDKRESWLHHLWNSSCRRQRWSNLVFTRTHKNTPLDCAAESAPAHNSTC